MTDNWMTVYSVPERKEARAQIVKKQTLTGLIVSVLTATVLLLSATPSAGADETNAADQFHSRHQAGVRLGVWRNQGDIHPAEAVVGNQILSTNIGGGSFYAEGFFAYRLTRSLMGEISLGIVNRGTVTIDENNTRDIVGNLLIYPILAQLKIYLPVAGDWHAQPYFTAGAGLYFGRRDVQFTTSDALFTGSNQETATKLSYVLGGGLDWPIGTVISLGMDAKYMPINYSKGFVTVNNYNAVVITFGVKYLIARK